MHSVRSFCQRTRSRLPARLGEVWGYGVLRRLGALDGTGNGNLFFRAQSLLLSLFSLVDDRDVYC